MCGHFRLHRVEAPTWVCPRGLEKHECGVCPDYSACMESAWALFEELVKKKGLDK